MPRTLTALSAAALLAVASPAAAEEPDWIDVLAAMAVGKIHCGMPIPAELFQTSRIEARVQTGLPRSAVVAIASDRATIIANSIEADPKAFKEFCGAMWKVGLVGGEAS